MTCSSSKSSLSNNNGAVLAATVVASVSTLAVVIVASWWHHFHSSSLNSNASDDLKKESLLDDIPEPNAKTDACVPEGEGPVLEVMPLDGTGILSQPEQHRVLCRGCITIVHGSVTGTCAKFAQSLYEAILLAQKSQSGSEKRNGSFVGNVQLATTEDFDWWDELINDEDEIGSTVPSSKSSTTAATLIVLLPTYTNGTWPPGAISLQEALQELQHDWRIASLPLKHKLHAAVFGMGSSAYDNNAIAMSDGTENNTSNNNGNDNFTNNMGQPSKEAIKAFQKLGAKVLTKLAIGDDSVGQHAQATFDAWKDAVLAQLFVKRVGPTSGHGSNRKQASSISSSKTTTATETTGGEMTKSSSLTACECSKTAEPSGTSIANNCCKTNDASSGSNGECCDHKADDNNRSDVADGDHSDENVSDDDDFEDDDDEDDDDDDDDDNNDEPDVMDLEDIGDAVAASRRDQTSSEPREMVTPSQAVALKKEGYKLIGTHSAVKLCRWTKHQLRGRGGCYKHTFYGITSYQCMEATPSLACANKCVFCWRHHKNPVGKEWRWKTDDPYFIVDQAVQTHVQMIKETRGIPGVQLDRWKEAHTVKHCALSLVGEPIMYPRIDELLGELHRRQISTFLVTNGQHPAAISSLRPITQLYVSVDAPTEPSLIAIDRPLFSDAWDRLKLSLSSLKDKGQRTVARLTVVKGWNFDEINGYASLIALGQVSLVEVKGVTFCGKSDASNLNMTNSPWHHEVVELTRTLRDELSKLRTVDPTIPEYDLACEHKHSCSVLLARVDQFAVDDPVSGRRLWKTWIDYEKFQSLAAQYAENPSFAFSVQDYTAETPAWALFGAKEEGFDPTDRRHRKQTKHPKYTQFDATGVPTHDENSNELTDTERKRLASMMKDRKRQIGEGSTITELRGGEKEILDASLMFRGLVVAK